MIFIDKIRSLFSFLVKPSLLLVGVLVGGLVGVVVGIAVRFVMALPSDLL